MRQKVPGLKGVKVTFERGSEIVVVSAWVPELHVLVCPPRNALLQHRNCSSVVVFDVIQLQSV